MSKVNRCESYEKFKFKPYIRQRRIFADSECLRVASDGVNRSIGMKFGASNRLHIFERCNSDEARSIGVARLHLKNHQESLEKKNVGGKNRFRWRKWSWKFPMIYALAQKLIKFSSWLLQIPCNFLPTEPDYWCKSTIVLELWTRLVCYHVITRSSAAIISRN